MTSAVTQSIDRIAVLTPVFNDADGLRRTRESLLAQDVAFDWIVVDDGSRPPMQVSADGFPGSIHCLTLPKNRGVTGALNFGLEYVLERDYGLIARLDAGDLAYPSRLREQQAAFRADPRLGVVGSAVRLIGPGDITLLTRRMPVSHSAILNRHRRTSGLVHSSTMIRVDVLRQVGCYDPRYPHAEDFDLWLRCQKVSRLGNLPEVLLDVHVVPDSISTNTRSRKTQVKSRLRLLCREFQWWSWRAHLGIAANCLLYFMSYGTSLKIKQLFQRGLSPGLRQPQSAG